VDAGDERRDVHVFGADAYSTVLACNAIVSDRNIVAPCDALACTLSDRYVVVSDRVRG
jgi:hypothetical protein